MSQIIEIGFDIKDAETGRLLDMWLEKLGIPYYVEPQRLEPYKTLEELEIACEGK